MLEDINLLNKYTLITDVFLHNYKNLASSTSLKKLFENKKR